MDQRKGKTSKSVNDEIPITFCAGQSFGSASSDCRRGSKTTSQAASQRKRKADSPHASSAKKPRGKRYPLDRDSEDDDERSCADSVSGSSTSQASSKSACSSRNNIKRGKKSNGGANRDEDNENSTSNSEDDSADERGISLELLVSIYENMKKVRELLEDLRYGDGSFSRNLPDQNVTRFDHCPSNVALGNSAAAENEVETDQLSHVSCQTYSSCAFLERGLVDSNIKVELRDGKELQDDLQSESDVDENGGRCTGLLELDMLKLSSKSFMTDLDEVDGVESDHPPCLGLECKDNALEDLKATDSESSSTLESGPDQEAARSNSMCNFLKEDALKEESSSTWTTERRKSLSNLGRMSIPPDAYFGESQP